MKVLAEVTTNVTYDRWSFTVILLYMVIQSLLYLKLLAACITRVIVVARMQPDVVILQGTLVIALVLAHAALVHLLSMILFDMGDQITPKAEGFRAVSAFVPMLLQVFGKIAFLQEPAATVIAFYARRLSSSRSILFSLRTKGLFC